MFQDVVKPIHLQPLKEISRERIFRKKVFPFKILKMKCYIEERKTIKKNKHQYTVIKYQFITSKIINLTRHKQFSRKR